MLLSMPTEAMRSPEGCKASPDAAPECDTNDIVFLPSSRTATSPEAVATTGNIFPSLCHSTRSWMAFPSPLVACDTSSFVIEYAQLEPFAPPRYATPLAPSNANALPCDASAALGAVALKLCMASGVIQSAGTGRFRRVLDNLQPSQRRSLRRYHVGDLRVFRRVYLRRDIVRKASRVDLHGITVCAVRCSSILHRHFRKRISRLVSLLC